jgi:hypothetical protein
MDPQVDQLASGRAADAPHITDREGVHHIAPRPLVAEISDAGEPLVLLGCSVRQFRERLGIRYADAGGNRRS